MKQLATHTPRFAPRSVGEHCSAPRAVRGFSLIELLVVIAIIALLAAIIFPVFATVRENGRQKSSLSNMHDISTKLEQYKLDHKTYPAILFGTALPAGYPGSSAAPYVPMDQAYAAAQADDAANAGNAAYISAVDTYFDGLYPEYVRDVNSFKDGNNSITDLTATQLVNVTTMNAAPPASDPVATVGPDSKNLYVVDAYDASPQVTGANQLAANLISRYNLSWTDITRAGTAPVGSGLTPEQYARQLRWQNPPADTYVTSTTYHVKNANKVLVLFQNGSTKAYDISLFLQPGADADIAPIANGTAAAKFWRMTP